MRGGAALTRRPKRWTSGCTCARRAGSVEAGKDRGKGEGGWCGGRGGVGAGLRAPLQDVEGEHHQAEREGEAEAPRPLDVEAEGGDLDEELEGEDAE